MSNSPSLEEAIARVMKELQEMSADQLRTDLENHKGSAFSTALFESSVFTSGLLSKVLCDKARSDAETQRRNVMFISVKDIEYADPIYMRSYIEATLSTFQECSNYQASLRSELAAVKKELDEIAEKATTWFSVLTKVSSLLDMPSDQSFTECASVLEARLKEIDAQTTLNL